MTGDLSDRAVIVTGAAGGIGSACARAFAVQGAKLVLTDIHDERLEGLCAELSREFGTNRFFPAVLDVTSEVDMNRMAALAIEKFGKIDALVAAAGILRTSGRPTTIVETSFDEWRKIVDINLTGTFLSNKAVLPTMIAQGMGDIVNISSTSGKHGRAFDGPYSASKFGIVGFSESLAEEVMRLGVRVQTLLPDAVDTPLWEQTGTTALRPRELLTPDQVAETVVYLLTVPRNVFLFNPSLHPIKLRTRKKPPE